MNRFLDFDGDGLPLLSDQPYCLSAAAASPSQVSDVFFVPPGTNAPDDWQSLAAWRAHAETSDVRHLVVIGAVDVPAKAVTQLPRQRTRRVRVRDYTLVATVIDLTQANYRLIRRLQTGRIGFRMWYANLSGRMFGGRAGIYPRFVDGDAPLGGEVADIERGILSLMWSADGDPDRSGLPVTSRPTIPGQIQPALAVWGEDENTIWGEDENTIWAYA